MRTVTVLRAFQRQGCRYNRWGSKLRPSLVSPVGSSFREANPNVGIRQPGSAKFQLLGWTSCVKGNDRSRLREACLRGTIGFSAIIDAYLGMPRICSHLVPVTVARVRVALWRS